MALLAKAVFILHANNIQSRNDTPHTKKSTYWSLTKQYLYFAFP